MRRIDLQTIRKERNITQKQLAELTGFPQGFVSKMERGVVSTSETFIAKVAEVFQIDDIDSYVYDSTNEQNVQKVKAVVEGKFPKTTATSDRVTIQRLFDLLDKREARIEKLEKEIDQLRRELAALSKGGCK